MFIDQLTSLILFSDCQDCGTMPSYFPSRTKSANSQTPMSVGLYLIHGGITSSGDVLSSYGLYDTATQQLSYYSHAPDDAFVPSARFVGSWTLK